MGKLGDKRSEPKPQGRCLGTPLKKFETNTDSIGRSILRSIPQKAKMA